MELFVADLVERFYTALWPFLRIGAMLLAVPILSIDAVTVRIRVLLTLMLTLMIYHWWSGPSSTRSQQPAFLRSSIKS